VEIRGKIRAEFPNRKITLIGDVVSYYRAKVVIDMAKEMEIKLEHLPS